MKAFGLLAVALALGPGSAIAKAAPKTVVLQLADGTELVHVHLPEAVETSLRWVVRSGAASDPSGKEGLAHLLEHLVFHGSYEMSEAQLFSTVRKAGAKLEALTMPDYTAYAIDAPTEAFPALMAALVSVVTNPALDMADLERERAVVATEGAPIPTKDMLPVADLVLFSGADGGATPLGSEASRGAIDHGALDAFYARYYVPANTSVIIVGAIDVERTRTILEQASRLPPSLPGESVPEVEAEPNLPLAKKAFAPYAMRLFGYALAGVDHETCRELAALLDLRLMMAVEISRPLAASIETRCARLRGHELLFAITTGPPPKGGELGDVLRATFRSAAKKGPTAKERTILKERSKNAKLLLKSDPAGIADALVPEVAVHPANGEPRRLKGPFVKARFEREDLLRAAKESFKKSREIEIDLSPAGDS